MTVSVCIRLTDCHCVCDLLSVCVCMNERERSIYIDRQTDRQAGRQAGRQADRYIDI